MGQRGAQFTILFRFFYLLCMALVLTLAVGCYSGLARFFEDSYDIRSKASWSFSGPLVSEQIKGLESRATQRKQRLSFMTFSIERVKEARELERILKKLINLSPFNPAYWQDLQFAEYVVTAPSNQRIWSLSAGLRVAGWNDQYRWRSTVYCLHEPTLIFTAQPKFCRELVSRMDKYSVHYLAGLTKVNGQELKQQIASLEKSFGFRSEALAEKDRSNE